MSIIPTGQSRKLSHKRQELVPGHSAGGEVPGQDQALGTVSPCCTASQAQNSTRRQRDSLRTQALNVCIIFPARPLLRGCNLNCAIREKAKSEAFRWQSHVCLCSHHGVNDCLESGASLQAAALSSLSHCRHSALELWGSVLFFLSARNHLILPAPWAVHPGTGHALGPQPLRHRWQSRGEGSSWAAGHPPLWEVSRGNIISSEK